MLTYREVQDRFIGKAKGDFEYSLRDGNFVVQQKSGDDDVVKLWRCGNPNSVINSFWVCSAPGCLIVYGDRGDYMWQRCPDMISFVRGSIGSLSYFSEKVPSDIKIKEDKHELIQCWIDTAKDEWIENGSEWTDEQEGELEHISMYIDEPQRFISEFFESSFYVDCESFPAIDFYNHNYLWVIEGLKWFIKELDTGKVIKHGQ